MLKLRTLSALAIVPLVAFFVWLGNWPFLAFIALLGLLGAYEVGQMLRRAELPPNWLALCGMALWPLVAAYWPEWGIGPWALSLVLLASLVWSALGPAAPPRGILGWGLSLAAGLYLGWPLSHFVLLRQMPGETAQGWGLGLTWVALVFAGTWAADTGAYLVGRLLGRHHLYPRLSPAKTWEGAFGGLLGAALAVSLIGPSLGLRTEWAVILGLALAVVAILGDLAESWLKRGFGVKDASRLIPGHGGVLDRLDSLLFSVVLVYYLGPLVAGR